MDNTVVMTIGGLTLGPNFPLFQRTFEVMRPNAQGHAFKRVNLQFDGFLLGDDHKQMVDQYLILAEKLNNNDTLFTYTVTSPEFGSVTLYDNKRVYVDGYSEPSDWKEYDGSYSFTLYYFEALGNTDSDLGITASLGSYTFDPLAIPTFARQTAPIIGDYTDQVLPIGYTTPSTSVSINLNGFLIVPADSVDPVNDLNNLIVALESALTANNRIMLFNYGPFSATVRVMDFTVQETVPRVQANYSIVLQYHTFNVWDLKVSYEIDRIHWNPIIKEKPRCNTRSIQLMNRSGQSITYNLSVKADTLSNARSQLSAEAAARVIPGGYELPGGRESQDENTNTVSVSIQRYYATPVMLNILDEGLLI